MMVCKGGQDNGLSEIAWSWKFEGQPFLSKRMTKLRIMEPEMKPQNLRTERRKTSRGLVTLGKHH